MRPIFGLYAAYIWPLYGLYKAYICGLYKAYIRPIYGIYPGQPCLNSRIHTLLKILVVIDRRWHYINIIFQNSKDNNIKSGKNSFNQPGEFLAIKLLTIFCTSCYSMSLFPHELSKVESQSVWV